MSRPRFSRIAAAAALTAALWGCAGPGSRSAATLPGTRAVSEDAARSGVVLGRSTQAQVLAALGPTTRVRFDSGYEVWVYRWEGGRPAAGAARDEAPARAAAKGTNTANGADEYVLLFDPAGIVTKARVRLAPRSP
jgi:hypothetical protein